jgi:hypothetical protein
MITIRIPGFKAITRTAPLATATGLGALTLALAVAGQAPASADPLPYGPDTCIQGFVWREANPNDHVCVTPAVRSQTAQENQLAGSRRDPNGGPYGPDTCLQGYVWRDAFEGDHVCVTPDVRTDAANDNAAAASRMAANLTPPPVNGTPYGPPETVNCNPDGVCTLTES